MTGVASVRMNPTDQDNASPMFFRFDQPRPRSTSGGQFFKRTLWAWVQATLFACSPSRCFAWRRLLLKAFGARVGAACRIERSVRVTHPWLLTLGDRCTLGAGVKVYNLGAIRVGDHTVISQHVHLCAGTHDFRDPHFPLVRSEITIGRSVWVAADAFIGPGVTLGDNCVVAARSVVVTDVANNALVGGNRAKVLRKNAREQNQVD